MKPPLSSLPELFKAWGITTNPTDIVVDFGQSAQVTGGSGKPEENPLILFITAETFNRENVLTSKLEAMLLGVSGTFKKAPDSPYDFEPLIFSSKKAGLTQPIELSKPVEDFKKTVPPTGEQYVLAAQVAGHLQNRLSRRPAKSPAGTAWSPPCTSSCR